MRKGELAQMRLDVDTACAELEEALNSSEHPSLPSIRHRVEKARKLLAKWSLDDEKPPVDD